MPKIPKISKGTLNKTGKDYVDRTMRGEKIRPGKGNCPANKFIKPKLK